MKYCPYCAETIPTDAVLCPYCNMDTTQTPGQAASGPAYAAPRRSGMSGWTIAMIVLAVGGGLMLLVVPILIALLLPAVQQAREAARRTQSRNNLKQIGLGIHNYHDTFRVLPPGGTFDEDGNGYHGWQTMLLPYLEQQPLFNQVDFEQPWDHPENAYIFRTVLPMYVNASETAAPIDANGFALSHYAGNEQVLGRNSAVDFTKILDGLSNTILAGEAAGNFRPWGAPDNYRDPAAVGINQGPNSFGRPTKDGVQFLLMDGSVRFVSENIDPAVLKALSTPDVGEPVGEF